MSDIERGVRELAYLLWEEAGRPHGRSDEFWFLAQQEMYGGAATSDGPDKGLPPYEQLPEVSAQHGVATGMPGERIAEQGVLDDRLDELALPSLVDTDED